MNARWRSLTHELDSRWRGIRFELNCEERTSAASCRVPTLSPPRPCSCRGPRVLDLPNCVVGLYASTFTATRASSTRWCAAREVSRPGAASQEFPRAGGSNRSKECCGVVDSPSCLRCLSSGHARASWVGLITINSRHSIARCALSPQSWQRGASERSSGFSPKHGSVPRTNDQAVAPTMVVAGPADVHAS